MSGGTSAGAAGVPAAERALAGVTAVVLTYRRPRLAGDVVRSLLADEGLRPEQVLVVVNGEGGLDDPALEASVRVVRLPDNTGPAGGFRAGLELATADPGCRWVYLCEDDVGLFDLPRPRLERLLGRITGAAPAHPGLGAVVAYGRSFVGRGAHTVNVVPESDGFVPVDVACWGATLVDRRVVDSGVLPDPDLFFGVEDFDFFCAMREAGWDVLVDGEAARAVAGQQTTDGRDAAIRDARPNDAAEPWRSYYHARNSLELTRRYGRRSWYGWYLAHTARQAQVARSGAERSAIAHGVWDGLRGRLGRNPAYGRGRGEHDAPGGPVGDPPAGGS